MRSFFRKCSQGRCMKTIAGRCACSTPITLNLRWAVIEAAGKMKSVEIFLNLMVMDINRNAMRRNPDKSVQSKMDQLTLLWGDETWKDVGYDTTRNFFNEPEKVSNEVFAEAFLQ